MSDDSEDSFYCACLNVQIRVRPDVVARDQDESLYSTSEVAKQQAATNVEAGSISLKELKGEKPITAVSRVAICCREY